MRVVTRFLPCRPNSGQTSITGASMSSLPRLDNICAHSAVAPLVQENTIETVSPVHGRRVAGSATPPQRSTTVRPSTVSASEAPTSPRPLKLRTNSSASISNAESQRPSTAPSCKECLKLLDAANHHSPTIDLQLIPNAEETIPLTTDSFRTPDRANSL